MTTTQTYPRYMRLITVSLLAAAAVFVLLPYVLRFFDPSAGSFGIDTLNALAFGAVLLAAILHLGFLAYSKVFPRFRTYQAESLEGEGKLFENITDELRAPLWQKDVEESMPKWAISDRIAFCVERRKVSQFQFIIRCVRLSFCLLAFYALVQLSEHVLIAALTVVPK
ncbi:MAG: hypothetical protein ACRYFZ_19705 [Janthinobacterium lividum]